jgi:hypothetical protein
VVDKSSKQQHSKSYDRRVCCECVDSKALIIDKQGPIMNLRLALLTSVSVIGFAVAAPAMAQTIINPQQATGALVQGNGATATQVISTAATGLTALAAGNQGNNNAVNLIGNGSSALAVSTSFGFGQVIGGIAAPDSTTLTQGSVNSISAFSVSSLQSNVTAALSGGNQSATNAANSATFSLLAGTTGSLTQAINTDIAGTNTMRANNAISANAVNGQASILGNGFGQVANNSLNSAAFVAAGAATIGLDQKSSTSILAASQVNTASAQVTAAGNPVIDPSITNLSQTAGFSLNSISGQGASNALTLTNGSDSVGQSSTFVTGSTIGSSNSQTALTGIGTLLPGNGISQISGSSQANSLSLNRVANAGSTSFGDLAGQFTQSVNTTNVTASGLADQTFGATNTVVTGATANLMVASTNAGAASVTGTPLGATNSTATQYRSVDLNSVSSGGLVSGTLAQSNAAPITLAQMPALNNVAAARTDIGAATVSSVSQAQVQSLNTLSGGGASGLNATQNANTVTFGGENRQNAVTGLGVATIGGGLQQMGSSVNVASLGALGAGSMLQTANAVSQNTANRLSATGGAAIASGSQTVTNTINAIR